MDPTEANAIRCPHGIESEYVYTYTMIDGERYVTGGIYYHDGETRCDL